jgi:monofunctional biosynthetic peptidoglycan transglycosylase
LSAGKGKGGTLRNAGRFLALLVVCGIALQLYFLLRVALMIVVDPQSTTFQRSEILRLAVEQHQVLWAQEWRPYAQTSDQIKRAVIASEDAGFPEHSGVEWEALEKAWERNQRAAARAQKINERLEQRVARAEARGKPAPAIKLAQAKIVGGSTITQQLAKNLFLSGERSALRKGQEFVITFMLEGLLSKQRILEIYLNNVEWGEGVFGVQAASRYYFHVDADRLGSWQAARLAVMLPAPKRFEKRPSSAYITSHAATVAARMGAVSLP